MVLVLTFVVLESADLPEVRVHGLLAVGKVLLREEVDLVLGDLRQVFLTRCDHRASGKNPPRTIYGAIVAEADRQIIPETVTCASGSTPSAMSVPSNPSAIIRNESLLRSLCEEWYKANR